MQRTFFYIDELIVRQTVRAIGVHAGIGTLIPSATVKMDVRIFRAQVVSGVACNVKKQFSHILFDIISPNRTFVHKKHYFHIEKNQYFVILKQR